MSKSGSKKNKILDLIENKLIHYIVGIDETRNGNRNEDPVIVSFLSKLNDRTIHMLLQKEAVCKPRPQNNNKNKYNSLIKNIPIDPRYGWFLFCDTIKQEGLSRVGRNVLTEAYLIKYLCENFVPLENTLFLIDGQRPVIDKWPSLEGLIETDITKRDNLNVINVIKGDERLEIISYADIIAHALVYGKLKEKYRDRKIDIQSYFEKSKNG